MPPAGSVPLTQDHLASLPAFLEATKRTETATTDRAGAMQELATTIKSLGIGGAPTATSTESGAQQPGGSQLGQQQGQLSITGGQAQPQQIPPTAGQTPQPSSMGQPGPLAENAPAGDAAASASGTSGGAAPTPTTVPATGSRGARVGRGTWRLQCYRSKGVLEDGAHLRLYFLQVGLYLLMLILWLWLRMECVVVRWVGLNNLPVQLFDECSAARTVCACLPIYPTSMMYYRHSNWRLLNVASTSHQHLSAGP